MKLTNVDYVSLIAIAVGGTFGAVGLGAAVFGSEWDQDHDHGTEQVQEIVAGTSAGVSTPSGTPAQIRIRGDVASATSGLEPLVYVDGARFEGGMDVVSSFDPDLVERIEVIKGEAAIELFGEEAANGVVQIFLKRGDGEDTESEEGR